jgi:hypothetical protein
MGWAPARHTTCFGAAACAQNTTHSGNIQGTFREHSGNIQGTFREHSGNISGNIEGTLKEHLKMAAVSPQLPSAVTNIVDRTSGSPSLFMPERYASFTQREVLLLVPASLEDTLRSEKDR